MRVAKLELIESMRTLVAAAVKGVVEVNGHAVKLRVVIACARKYQAALLLLRYLYIVAQVVLVSMYYPCSRGLSKKVVYLYPVNVERVGRNVTGIVKEIGSRRIAGLTYVVIANVFLRALCIAIAALVTILAITVALRALLINPASHIGATAPFATCNLKQNYKTEKYFCKP